MQTKLKCIINNMEYRKTHLINEKGERLVVLTKGRAIVFDDKQRYLKISIDDFFEGNELDGT